MAAKVNRGPTYEKDGNTFIGYVVDAKEPEGVQEAYAKVKLNHAEANHVVCAYMLPGENKLELSDGCDDNDFGAARPIVDMMKRNNISHRAIFVVRNSTEKLYGERMNMYLKTAESVITAFPMNEILQQRQEVRKQTDEGETQPRPRGVVRRGVNRARKTDTNRGRGGGRGRGGRGGWQSTRGTSSRGGHHNVRKQDEQIVTYIPKSEVDLQGEQQTSQFPFSTPWDAKRAQDALDKDSIEVD